jgi:hypothetical protein
MGKMDLSGMVGRMNSWKKVGTKRAPDIGWKYCPPQAWAVPKGVDGGIVVMIDDVLDSDGRTWSK